MSSCTLAAYTHLLFFFFSFAARTFWSCFPSSVRRVSDREQLARRHHPHLGLSQRAAVRGAQLTTDLHLRHAMSDVMSACVRLCCGVFCEQRASFPIASKQWLYANMHCNLCSIVKLYDCVYVNFSAFFMLISLVQLNVCFMS